ncbi:MAG: DUF5320 domain-containing protein [Thermodesulfovibrionales bacterium]
MPFGDRTGPLGLGPRTGRAAGYCSGFGMPGYANPLTGRGWFGFGRGWGRGWFGGGRGWRNWYRATGLPGWARIGYGYPGFVDYPYSLPLTSKEEMDLLKDRAKFFKQQLENIENRISTLEKAQEEEGK